MEKLKDYIRRYFIIVMILIVIKFLLKEILPDLYVKTIEGDGFTQTKTNFFGMYHHFLYNLILAIFIFIDLGRLKSNRIFIPILTFASMIPGLFFFSVILYTKLIDKKYIYE